MQGRRARGVAPDATAAAVHADAPDPGSPTDASRGGEVRPPLLDPILIRKDDPMTQPLAESPRTTRTAHDPLNLIDVDHVHFYVGNAKQAAFFYAHCFGFEIDQVSDLTTGNRTSASYLLTQGNIRLLLTSGLSEEHPASREVARFGDGVKDIAFTVNDATAAYERAVANGGPVGVRTDREPRRTRRRRPRRHQDLRPRRAFVRFSLRPVSARRRQAHGSFRRRFSAARSLKSTSTTASIRAGSSTSTTAWGTWKWGR